MVRIFCTNHSAKWSKTKQSLLTFNFQLKIALANGTVNFKLTNQKRLSIKLFSHKRFLVRAICFLSNIILCIISLSGEPVVITVGLWVLSIDSINVVDMVGWISLYKFYCKSNISVSKLFCNLCYPL